MCSCPVLDDVLWSGIQEQHDVSDHNECVYLSAKDYKGKIVNIRSEMSDKHTLVVCDAQGSITANDGYVQ